MAILFYSQITQPILSNLDRARTAVLMSVGPMEQHGPHLPLGTDPLQSDSIIALLCERLQKTFPDWNFLIFPTIPAGCDTIEYAGSIEVKPSTLRALIYDILKQLAKDKFNHIIAISAHGGPRHLVVLEELAEKMRWRHRTRMISASSRIILEVLQGRFIDKIDSILKKTGDTLSAEERAGLRFDLHGGLLETSLMLHLHPKLVDPEFKKLRPALLEKLWRMNRRSGKKIGDGLGYLGTPALARPEIGAAALDAIFQDIVPFLERFLRGEDVRKFFRSKFYYIPFMRTDFKWVFIVALYAIAFGAMWSYLVRIMSEVMK